MNETAGLVFLNKRYFRLHAKNRSVTCNTQEGEEVDAGKHLAKRNGNTDGKSCTVETSRYASRKSWTVERVCRWREDAEITGSRQNIYNGIIVACVRILTDDGY